MSRNKKRKYPDLVVYSEDKGFYSKELTYGSNVGAPAIKLEDVTGWKKTQALVANKQFKSKYEELREEFKRLVDEVSWNEFVYSSKYNFIPVMGETYYLYEKKDGGVFLSLIKPNEWPMKFIGATKLESTQKWIRVYE
jgi:hypothetical protein